MIPKHYEGRRAAGKPLPLSIDDIVLRKLFSRSVAKAAPTWKIDEVANGETALRLVDLVHYDFHGPVHGKHHEAIGTDTVRALRAKRLQEYDLWSFSE
jgi:hypothetical protein